MTNDWDIANTYFHYNLPTTQISEKDIEETVKHLNETVYNYFKYNFGLVDYAKEGEGNFPEMYKTFTKHQLKKKLKQLKSERNPSVSRVAVKYETPERGTTEYKQKVRNDKTWNNKFGTVKHGATILVR